MIVVPLLILATDMAFGPVTVTQAGKSREHGGANSTLAAVPFALEFVLNFLLTGLIIGKLYYVGRRTRIQRRLYHAVAVAFVEGGVLFSLTTTLLQICYALKVSPFPLCEITSPDPRCFADERGDHRLVLFTQGLRHRPPARCLGECLLISSNELDLTPLLISN